jgi:hypothetical protein
MRSRAAVADLLSRQASTAPGSGGSRKDAAGFSLTVPQVCGYGVASGVCLKRGNASATRVARCTPAMRCANHRGVARSRTLHRAPCATARTRFVRVITKAFLTLLADLTCMPITLSLQQVGGQWQWRARSLCWSPGSCSLCLRAFVFLLPASTAWAHPDSTCFLPDSWSADGERTGTSSVASARR